MLSPNDFHLEKMLKHDMGEAQKLIVVNSDSLSSWIQEKLRTLHADEAIGWSSLCTKNDNTFCHVPMMDFSCVFQIVTWLL